MEKVYIYALCDPITEAVKYIGKTKDLNQRYSNHLRRNEHNRKSRWIQGLKKKGLKPILIVLDYVPVSDWDFWEQHYVFLYRSWGFNLHNIELGGGRGKIFSQETLKKKSVSATKNNPKYWLGKKRSNETKKKISAGNKGKTHTKETKEKLSKLFKGRKNSPDHIKKISNALTGKKLSDHHKKRLSEGHSRKKAIIMCSLDGIFIKEFESMPSALKYLGRSSGRQNISAACKGKVNSAFGYKWHFKN